jgi:hypothetical protein
MRFPRWHGNQAVRNPFLKWAPGWAPLLWYQAYNKTKHNRYEQFEEANLENLVDAIGGLVVLLTSQFYRVDFFHERYSGLSSRDKDFEVAIGDYFLVKYPTDWKPEEQYDFDWQQLKTTPDPFQLLPL